MKKIFSLTNDLRSLYFKLGNKEVENLFIKLSAISINQVEDWLSLDNNIKSVYSKLKDKNIINAILFLKGLKEQYPAGLDLQTLSKSLIFDPKCQKQIPYLLIFNNLCSKFDVLLPYQKYLDVFGKLSLQGSSLISESSVSDDLMIIQNEIEAENLEVEEGLGEIRLSRKDQINIAKVEMYSYLFKRFSTELAKEASSRGLKALEGVISKGLLNSPHDLSSATSINNPIKSDDIKAKEIVRTIIKNYGTENFQKNYEYIKAEVLQEKDLLPFNDPMSREKRDTLNFNFIINPEKRGEWMKQKEKSLIHRNELFLGKESLTFLSTIFFFYHKEVSHVAKFIPDAALESLQ